MKKIPSSEITPEHLYRSRRRFIKGAGIAAASAAFLAACRGEIPGTGGNATPTAQETALGTAEITEPQVTPEPNRLWNPEDDPLTSFEDVTHYNNYYEFTTDKVRVANLAEDMKTSPWEVEVSGFVNNPRTYTLEDIYKFEQEERIYRLRCVEAWSMVIPWLGFPISKLLNEVEPTSDAKYLKMTTVLDTDSMDGLRQPFPWPYIEGLRLDEAMNDLAIFATGLYGKNLEPQNGAPVRLVVPWKYGFKSLKSIVKIELVEEMPISFWNAIAPNEYGFYANVNPNVDHPRWSQATERRIGETGRRETLMLNGYEEEVAYLYEGMDLTKWY
jgi:sulfoxide reductase catalytic subunit YedY